ncbi:MAG: response regulator [Myxococcales bacterium]|nr:MAG: response regulator [Myxococcales bacterium]
MMEITGKILVVDDEEIVLLSIRKVFRGAKYEIDTVQSPQLGLAMMESRKYDVVITDLMMPGMNGMEFLEKVKTMDPAVRVIMITGYATMRTALQSMRRGAFDFLAKPFTKEELSNIVHRAMQKGPLSEAAETAPQEIFEGGVLDPGRVYVLPNHAWARIEPDHHVLIGIDKSFLQTVGQVAQIELPEIGENVSQGGGCAKVTSSDERTYTLWCPLSGRVLEVNKKALAEPASLSGNHRDSWLFKIDPTGIEMEVENLLT